MELEILSDDCIELTNFHMVIEEQQNCVEITPSQDDDTIRIYGKNVSTGERVDLGKFTHIYLSY